MLCTLHCIVQLMYDFFRPKYILITIHASWFFRTSILRGKSTVIAMISKSKKSHELQDRVSDSISVDTS